jgi:CheY-like chemotaxis protein
MTCVVLLVDDDAAFRGLAARILTSWGHEVVQAGSAAEALAQVAEHHPGVAVVDIGLPDGDGFELSRELVRSSPLVRVVLISTDSAAGNAFAARRAGADGFVPKDQLITGDLRQWLDSVHRSPGTGDEP